MTSEHSRNGRLNPTFLLLTVICLGVFYGPVKGANLTKFQMRKAECNSQPPLVCVLRGTSGYEVSGTVTFTSKFVFIPRRKEQSGYHMCVVWVFALIRGLTPGKHGFHIHTYGDERLADGTSTGGHFTNPDGTIIPHGFPSSTPRHWGDLGNVHANAGGVASYVHRDGVISIPSIIGRAITIHAGEDKGPAFQPTGDSGARVATCVIGIANPYI